MKNLFTILVLSSILICGVAANAASERPRILFLGDSLTAGYGLPESQSYPSLLKKKLADESYNYEIVNAGVSGDTTAGGLRRLDWLMRKPAQVMVLALGANDGLRGIDPRETAKNLMEIIRSARAKNPDIKILLAGMLIPPSMGERYADKFRAVFPEVAEQQDVALLPFFFSTGSPQTTR